MDRERRRTSITRPVELSGFQVTGFMQTVGIVKRTKNFGYLIELQGVPVIRCCRCSTVDIIHTLLSRKLSIVLEG